MQININTRQKITIANVFYHILLQRYFVVCLLIKMHEVEGHNTKDVQVFLQGYFVS